MSDQLFKKRKKQLREKKENTRIMKPLRVLIVCEGEKTEPNYFEHFRKKVNEKFGQTGGMDFVKIDGTGRNTVDLVEYTEKTAKEAKIGFGNVWCVFDKDNFTDEQFNAAICKCHHNGYKAAWSNECVELWFMLHFQYLNTAIDRDAYKKKLDGIFRRYGINNGKYEKNSSNIYEMINEYGNEAMAIKHAKKLDELYEPHTTPSLKNPMTKIYILVEELMSLTNE